MFPFLRKGDDLSVLSWIQPAKFLSRCHRACTSSSCALIFIAGVVRAVDFPRGELGLHRPYLASRPQSRQVVEKQIPLMLSEVKQYIAEMGITDNFYQQMMNTEPSQMAIYGPVHPTTSDGAALPTSDAKALGLRWDSYRKLVPEYDPCTRHLRRQFNRCA
jgi:hypothetical protein